MKPKNMQKTTPTQQADGQSARIVHFFLLWAVLTLLMASPVLRRLPAAEELRERWMAIYLQDKRVGHVHMRTERHQEDGQTRFVTHIRQRFTVSRGRSTIRFRIDQRVVEDPAGRVLSFRHNLRQGPIEQKMRGRREDGRLIILTGEQPDVVRQVVEAPEVLGPRAAEEVARARGYRPGIRYTLPIFMAGAPTQVVRAQVRVGEKEAKQMFEVTKWLRRVEISLSVLPNATTVQWVDDEGRPWLTTTRIGPLRLELRRVSRSFALQSPEKAEVMLSIAITTDRPVPNPRDLDRLVLLLRPGEGGGTLPELPSGPDQEVTKEGDALRVELRRVQPDLQKSYRLPCEKEGMDNYLRETPWLEIREERIKRMSRKAVSRRTDAVEAARAIESYVAAEITEKSLGMGFATAGETARQKAGDCTEHAVLAAALARAAGMPARVVCGLAYGGPMPGDTQARFYYHMWAEIYAGEWLPIDPALGSHDATHLAVVRSDLSHPDDVAEISAAVMGLPGGVRIEVLQVGEEKPPAPR
jgi:transglutaminase-like putative cysteine protease